MDGIEKILKIDFRLQEISVEANSRSSDSTRGRAGRIFVQRCALARKRDLKHVDAVCRRYRHLLTGDLEFDYRAYLHDCKDCGDRGADDGDFTDAELIEKLKEFLGLEERP